MKQQKKKRQEYGISCEDNQCKSRYNHLRINLHKKASVPMVEKGEGGEERVDGVRRHEEMDKMGIKGETEWRTCMRVRR